MIIRWFRYPTHNNKSVYVRNVVYVENSEKCPAQFVKVNDDVF